MATSDPAIPLKSEDSRNIFSMKKTMYGYPLFLEGDVVVSRGKAVRYRVFEITENRNE